MSILVSTNDGSIAKRAQSAALALHELDDKIAFTTRAIGVWINDDEIVRALDIDGVRVRRIHIDGKGQTLIDVIEDGEEIFGLRSVGKDAQIIVRIVQYIRKPK